MRVTENDNARKQEYYWFEEGKNGRATPAACILIYFSVVLGKAT